MKSDLSNKGDEQRIQIEEYLKNADRFVKSGEFSTALLELEKVFAIDPMNAKALAYKQRIQNEQTNTGKPSIPKEVTKPLKSGAATAKTSIVEEEAKGKAQEQRKLADEELRRRALELDNLRKLEDEQRRKAEKEREKTEEAKHRLEKVRQLLGRDTKLDTTEKLRQKVKEEPQRKSLEEVKRLEQEIGRAHV